MVISSPLAAQPVIAAVHASACKTRTLLSLSASNSAAAACTGGFCLPPACMYVWLVVLAATILPGRLYVTHSWWVSTRTLPALPVVSGALLLLSATTLQGAALSRGAAVCVRHHRGRWGPAQLVPTAALVSLDAGSDRWACLGLLLGAP